MKNIDRIKNVDEFSNWREFTEKLEKFRKTMELVKRYSTRTSAKPPEYESWQDGKIYEVKFI